ncbi:hypothetical protein P4O66_018778, partial [Electrophorus voltai]
LGGSVVGTVGPGPGFTKYPGAASVNMSVVFVPKRQRGKAQINQETIQRLLDENEQLVRCITEYMQKGRATECVQYQQILHRNIVYLGTIADASSDLPSTTTPLCEEPSVSRADVTSYWSDHHRSRWAFVKLPPVRHLTVLTAERTPALFDHRPTSAAANQHSQGSGFWSSAVVGLKPAWSLARWRALALDQ